MYRFIPYLILFLFSHALSHAQKRIGKLPTQNQGKTVSKYPKRTNLAFSAGATRSVVYLARNVKPDNDATGFNTALVYGGARLLRLSLEYTRYKTIDIAPTWYSIKANTVELNMHILARFRGKNAYFYPLVGLSYNTFSGTYTGVYDYLNLGNIYPKNERAVTHWWGINLGTGYEYYFKPGSFFLDYKMRIGRTEGYNQLNIQDVCISAGLRFNLRVPSVYSLFIYRNTRSRYLLDTYDAD